MEQVVWNCLMATGIALVIGGLLFVRILLRLNKLEKKIVN